MKENAGVSRDEQMAILSGKKLPSTPASGETGQGYIDYTAEKQRFLLPLIINAIGLIIVAAAIIYYAVGRHGDDITLEEATFTTVPTQSRVFQAVKAEDQHQLSEKQLEIDKMQLQIQRIEDERGILQREKALTLARRETELETAHGEEVSSLINQLRSEDLSDGELKRRSATIEDEQKAEYQLALEALRTEIEESYALREQALTDRAGDIGGILRLAQQELAIMRSTLAGSAGGIRDQQALALREVEAFRKRQEAIEYLLSEFSIEIEMLVSTVRAELFEEALERIDRYETINREASAEEHPSITFIRATNMGVLGLISTLIEERGDYRATVTEDVSSQAISAYIGELEIPTLRGEAYRQAGKLEEAYQYYTESIEQIPAIAVAHRRLIDAQRDQQTEQFDAKTTELDAITAALESKTAEADGIAVELEAKTAEFEARVAELQGVADGEKGRLATEIENLQTRISELEGERSLLLDKIAEVQSRTEALQVGYQNVSADHDALTKRVTGMRDTLRQNLEEVSQIERLNNDELVAMLQNKMRVKLILNAPSIADRYPGLADELDQYFIAMRDDDRIAKELETLQKTLGVVENVLAGRDFSW